MFKLDCPAQNYAWGKIGNSSAVAQLKSGSGAGDCTIDDTKPYAELWMGTHPSGPAKVDKDKTSLLEWIQNHRHYVGKVPAGYEDNDLPFMFKVLSINTALSIQAHPDRALATKLHAQSPQIYKDPNHKPEMAIALTDFEGMDGFRPMIEIANHLDRYPEFKAIVGNDVYIKVRELVPVDNKYVWCDEKYSSSGLGHIPTTTATEKGPGSNEWAVLKLLLEAILSCPDDTCESQLSVLVTRLQNEKDENMKGKISFVKGLILRLAKQYPNDRGILFPLVLNTVSLQAGESFYMAANAPHAYISGDILECMALSDNVVRVGLTPKFRDKETLCGMLDYRCGPVSWVRPIRVDSCTFVYRPPMSTCTEFEVEQIAIPSSYTYHFMMHDCASILIILEGENATWSWKSTIRSRTSSASGMDTNGNVLKDYADGDTQALPSVGSCIFMGAGVQCTVQTTTANVLIYRSHINLG